ncbi:MAG: hypothetical protein KG075_22190 [Alphaproteobacteria bacterium]|nr:hypothetical protein [Alphaproteobacteria bacterium]
MSFTYPLTHPTAPGFRRAAFTMLNVVGVSRSPFTLVTKAFKHQGEGWRVDIQLPPIKNRVRVGQWQAFFAALQGRAGTFYLADPDFLTPIGSVSGTPVANSAGSPSVNLARTRTLYAKGFNSGDQFLAGSRLSLGTGAAMRLHMLLEDAVIAGDGTAALSVWPALYADVADEAAITINNARGCFRLAGDVGWDSDAAKIFGFSFVAESEV